VERFDWEGAGDPECEREKLEAESEDISTSLDDESCCPPSCALDEVMGSATKQHLVLMSSKMFSARISSGMRIVLVEMGLGLLTFAGGGMYVPNASNSNRR
jgi:hypothetical protein